MDLLCPSLSLTRSVALVSGCLCLNPGSTAYWLGTLGKPFNFPKPQCPHLYNGGLIIVPALGIISMQYAGSVWRLHEQINAYKVLQQYVTCSNTQQMLVITVIIL